MDTHGAAGGCGTSDGEARGAGLVLAVTYAVFRDGSGSRKSTATTEGALIIAAATVADGAMGAAVEAMVAGGGGGAVDAPTPRVQLCKICAPSLPAEALCWAACSAWLVGLTARGGVADGLAAFEGIADSEAEASATKEAAEKAAAQAAAEKEVVEKEEVEAEEEMRPAPTLPSRRRVAASHESIAPTLAAPPLAALPTTTLPASASGAGTLLVGEVPTPGTSLGAHSEEGPSAAAFGIFAAATVDDAADAGEIGRANV